MNPTQDFHQELLQFEQWNRQNHHHTHRKTLQMLAMMMLLALPTLVFMAGSTLTPTLKWTAVGFLLITVLLTALFISTQQTQKHLKAAWIHLSVAGTMEAFERHARSQLQGIWTMVDHHIHFQDNTLTLTGWWLDPQGQVMRVACEVHFPLRHFGKWQQHPLDEHEARQLLEDLPGVHYSESRLRQMVEGPAQG
ncbi:hypothetical protein [Deinococcus roseus]|uniref:Uncharacterized protein n=1 Tax=Deinococcus roseus TaxID=392414 RepID=A0ABQ2DFU3_9DEIO|nr:hypothetical protein [Deinococcus roseus]GGJ55779.1 hypothetical protein GCM10008938_47470 [Deinococcus roseus]